MNTRKQTLEARIELVRNFLIVLKMENSSAYRQATRHLPTREKRILQRMARSSYRGTRAKKARVSAPGGTPAAQDLAASTVSIDKARNRVWNPKRAEWVALPFNWAELDNLVTGII